MMSDRDADLRSLNGNETTAEIAAETPGAECQVAGDSGAAPDAITFTQRYIAQKFDLRPQPLVGVCGMSFNADGDAKIREAWERYAMAKCGEIDRMMMDMNPWKEFREAADG